MNVQDRPAPTSAGPGRREIAVMAGIGLVIAAALVALTLQREPPPAFAPTEAHPSEVGNRIVGPIVYTIDARDGERWAYFDFSLGSTIENAGPTDWDIAIRRFRIIANGGRGFAGDGAIADLGPITFDRVLEAPASGWTETVGQRVDSTNAAIQKWYQYGFTSHLLTPKPHVWAVRTADGRYAKFEILGYYCPGATPGCVTIRYVYQGSGSRTF